MNLSFYRKLPFPRNIWSTVFEREVPEEDIPENWTESLSYALETLNNEREAAILLCYFKGQDTWEKIGSFYGITRSRAQAIGQHGMKRLRHPARGQRILLYGLDKNYNVPRDNDLTEKNPLDMDIYSMCIPVYAAVSLRIAGIKTVGDLTKLTEKELFKIRNIGEVGVSKIVKCLEELSLSLSPEIVPDLDAPVSSGQPITTLNLNSRVTQALLRSNVTTVERLTSHTEAELLSCRGIGVNAIKKIKERLSRNGLSLAEEN